MSCAGAVRCSRQGRGDIISDDHESDGRPERAAFFLCPKILGTLMLGTSLQGQPLILSQSLFQPLSQRIAVGVVGKW